MKNKYITIRVSEEEKKELKKIAKTNNMTISKYLVYNGLVGKKLKITKIIEIETNE